MAVGPAQMGPNAVQNPAALVAALKTQQPAQNPQTPFERINPDQQALENIKAASVSVERALQFTNDDQLKVVLNIISGVLNKALLKFDGHAVMQSLQEAMQSVPPPVAPGMGAQSPAGGPPQPGGMPPGGPAAPPGLPPQMGMAG